MKSTSRQLRVLAVSVVLALATAAVYMPAADNGFVYDDEIYVSRNPVVRSGLSPAGMRWAFTTFTTANWHPLTWLSHMLDVSLFGVNPRAMHLVNLLLHVLVSLLLFRFLERATRAPWRSAVVAAIFALHPLHVESAAWIAERKDLLCGLFWMLAMLAYLRYVERPGKGRYAGMVLLFALGLLAKPMIVTLPFALLLLDYWPLGRLALPGGGRRAAESVATVAGAGAEGPDAPDRPAAPRAGPAPLRRLLLEKTPLFALSAASCVATYVAQKSGGAVGTLAAYPLASRLGNALVSYATYLGKMVWPVSLSVFYNYPDRASLGWQAAGAGVLLLVLSVGAVASARARPYLAAGWFWFLGTLVPVIGLVQVGEQAMADRYTYIPMVGLAVAVAWTGADLGGPRRAIRAASAGAAAAVLLALALQSRAQLAHWRTPVALFSRAASVTTGNWQAHYNLGVALAGEGRRDEALASFRAALALKPDDAALRNNLGAILREKGMLDEAGEQFAAALALDPGRTDAHFNMGLVLLAKGRAREASGHFREVLRLAPNDREAFLQWSIARSLEDGAKR